MLVFAAAMVSCSEKIVNDSPQLSHDMIVLGEQLSDPYSVDNITKALAALYPETRGRAAVEPTDFYVRFLPKTDEDLQLLEDLGLQLIDHPLDYRIVRDGDWYHDPDLSEDEITWQYSVVPVDFEFPRGIRYERLEDCYLAEHDPATKSDGIDWFEVEREAFRISGNASMLRPLTKGDLSAVPEGYITIMDPDYSSDPVGVKGVQVYCNSFVKICNAFTDEQGHYKMSRSYASDVRYCLAFKNAKGFNQGIYFVLMPASVSTLGVHPASGCNTVIDCYSNYNLFSRCVVNNAGFDYIKLSEQSAGDIPAPARDLRIWDLPLARGNFNIMMHHGVILETFEPLHTVLGPYVIIAKMVQPDVYLGLDSCSSYNEVYGRALRVFAQAGMYSRAGAAWWHEYVVSEVGDTVMKSFEELLGNVGTEHGGVSSYVELVHLYSNYCQTVLYRRHYPESTEVFGEEPYSPQLLLYLDERGLGLEKLAKIFSQDVTDKAILKQKMLSYYPQFKTVILEAFDRYGKD